MQATEHAVMRLTTPHTEMTEAGPVAWPPLLAWLDNAVTEVVGRSGGSGGAGVPLNTDALDLLKYIDGRIKSMVETLRYKHPGDRINGVKWLWRAAKDERSGGRIEDAQWEMICDELQEWVARIEAQDDRPRKMELTVPCPRCDFRWVLEGDVRVAAIVVEFKVGRAPVAECRNDDCLAIWAGWSEVAKLGFTVGADQNAAILEACGIEVPKLATFFE